MKHIVGDKIVQNHNFCPGCGYGIVTRLIEEVVSEIGMSDDVLGICDVACNSLIVYYLKYDWIVAPHGRSGAVSSGVKRVRKNQPVLSLHGDGAAYSIGFSETLHSAIRNENITMIVVNNGVFAMTGGQMSPTTLAGQKVSTCLNGRDITKTGSPVNIGDFISHLDIAYLARGSLHSVAEITKTKNYLRQAFGAQMNNEGFSLVEILSPCPTNWGMTPVQSIAFIKEKMCAQYPLGEMKARRSGRND